MSVNDRYGRTVDIIYADQWSVTTDYGTVDSDVELPNELKPNRKHIIKQSKLYPHKTQPVLHRCHAIWLNIISSVEKISKIISREVVEANIFNENLMSILAAFILQLSPFLDNTPMDDQKIVDEGKLSLIIELLIIFITYESYDISLDK